MDKERNGVVCCIDSYKLLVNRESLAEDMRGWNSIAKKLGKRPGEPIGETFSPNQNMSADRLAVMTNYIYHSVSKNNIEMMNKECERVKCYIDGNLNYFNRKDLARNMRTLNSIAKRLGKRPGEPIGKTFSSSQNMSADRFALVWTYIEEQAKYNRINKLPYEVSL